EPGITQHHDLRVRRPAGQRLVHVVEPAGQRVPGELLGLLHAVHTRAVRTERAVDHHVGEAGVVTTDGNGDEGGARVHVRRLVDDIGCHGTGAGDVFETGHRMGIRPQLRISIGTTPATPRVSV